MTKLEIMTALAAAHIAGRDVNDGDGDFGMFAPLAPSQTLKRQYHGEMLASIEGLADELILLAECDT